MTKLHKGSIVSYQVDGQRRTGNIHEITSINGKTVYAIKEPDGKIRDLYPDEVAETGSEHWWWGK